jgi:integrase
LVFLNQPRKTMKSAFRLTCRSGVYYSFNTTTGARKSLHTCDRAEAVALLAAKTQSEAQSILNLKMAKVYLSASDPKALTRTWRDVLNSLIESKTGENRARWERMDRHKPFSSLWKKIVIQTTAEDFMRCLTSGSVTTNKFLRVLRNFALDFGWLPHPLIPTRHWPAVKYGKKRAITAEEHDRIIARETNPERKAFYELAWCTGTAQTDLANLTDESIDWDEKKLAFSRKKTGTAVVQFFGLETERVLRSLPSSGPLFPYLKQVRAADRATEFKQRCDGLGIVGATLHSYRYAWAERAAKCGYPQRHAMKALGHASKSVAQACRIDLRGGDESRGQFHVGAPGFSQQLAAWLRYRPAPYLFEDRCDIFGRSRSPSNGNRVTSDGTG